MPILHKISIGTIILLFLSGCGSTPLGDVAAQNTSPATTSSGPVVITTDHAVYAPTDLLHVTIMNGLTQPLYAYDHQASCSLLTMEQQVQGSWQPLVTPLAGCAIKSPTRLVQIASHATYQGTITAGYLRQGEANFPAGQYRLRFTYQLTATQEISPAPTESSAFSATLTIDPATPPQPLPTQPAPGTGSGTAITGTAVTAIP